MPLAIANLTKRPAPSGPFDKLKNKILGVKYDLSLVFCGPALTRKLNQERRNKDKIANILSFPLTKDSGEIFIKLPANDFSVDYLFIHGLLHLKGFAHGSKMEAEEKKFLSSLKNGQSTNHCWTRCGHRLGTPSRLRV
ncbi:MAG: rRNA maturation RNAse YbeY [Candidatus Paceibacterota bacterium]|jgi:ssRNA-specific RNase YbeY (16S rRNA maturation enzyme)